MFFNSAIEKLPLIVLASLVCGNAIGAATQSPETEATTTEKSAPVDMVIKKESRRLDVVYGEPVNRVFAPQVHNWVVLDQQRLILYATRSRPYLVTLRRKAMGLTSSTVIGLKRHGNSFDARFDQIYVDGFPYSIKRMEKLTVETARRLRGLEVEPEQKDQAIN